MAILVVDDDQAVRDSLRRALTMQGYSVELAADGREALDKLSANGGIDLLILDLLMPGSRSRASSGQTAARCRS